MTRRRQRPAGPHPRHLDLDKTFTPLSVDTGDELFPNGIFEFNVTKMLAVIESSPAKFPVEKVEVEPLRGYSPEILDENTIRRADVSRPVILRNLKAAEGA